MLKYVLLLGALSAVFAQSGDFTHALGQDIQLGGHPARDVPKHINEFERFDVTKHAKLIEPKPIEPKLIEPKPVIVGGKCEPCKPGCARGEEQDLETGACPPCRCLKLPDPIEPKLIEPKPVIVGGKCEACKPGCARGEEATEDVEDGLTTRVAANHPRPSPYSPGTRVMTQWTRAEGGDDLYYPGKIDRCNGHTCGIHYDDGDTWKGSIHHIRRLPPFMNIGHNCWDKGGCGTRSGSHQCNFCGTKGFCRRSHWFQHRCERTAEEEQDLETGACPPCRCLKLPDPIAQKPIKRIEFKPKPIANKPVKRIEFKPKPIANKPIKRIEFKPKPIANKPTKRIEFKPKPIANKPTKRIEFKPKPIANKPIKRI